MVNVATLPGIINYSFAMPDIHLGYGFAIGGVAAMDVDEGVISPGGVGYDINCGVRLVRTSLTADEIKRQARTRSSTSCSATSRRGVGVERRDREAHRARTRSRSLVKGAAWAVSRGMGTEYDLDTYGGARPARRRGPRRA